MIRILKIPQLILTLCVFLQLSSCGKSSTQTQPIDADCNCQLAPEGEVFLEKRASYQSNSNPSITEVRQAVREKLLREQGEIVEVAKVENRTIPGLVGEIPIRIYTPKEEGNFPIILFYHGDGFVTKNVSLNIYAQQALNEAATAINTAFNTSKKGQ